MVYGESMVKKIVQTTNKQTMRLVASIFVFINVQVVLSQCSSHNCDANTGATVSNDVDCAGNACTNALCCVTRTCANTDPADDPNIPFNCGQVQGEAPGLPTTKLPSKNQAGITCADQAMASGSKTSGCTATECCTVVLGPQKYLCKDPLDYKGNDALVAGRRLDAMPCGDYLYNLFFVETTFGFVDLDFSQTIPTTRCPGIKTFSICSCTNTAAAGYTTSIYSDKGFINTDAARVSESECKKACDPNDATKASFSLGCFDDQMEPIQCSAQLDVIATHCCTERASAVTNKKSVCAAPPAAPQKYMCKDPLDYKGNAFVPTAWASFDGPKSCEAVSTAMTSIDFSVPLSSACGSDTSASGPNCEVRATINWMAKQCCTERANAATKTQSTCYGIPYKPQQDDQMPYTLTECKDGVAYTPAPPLAPQKYMCKDPLDYKGNTFVPTAWESLDGWDCGYLSTAMTSIDFSVPLSLACGSDISESGPNCGIRASINWIAKECCIERTSAATKTQSTCYGIPYKPQENDETPYTLTECEDGVVYAASAPAPAPAPVTEQLGGSQSIRVEIVFVVMSFLVVVLLH